MIRTVDAHWIVSIFILIEEDVNDFLKSNDQTVYSFEGLSQPNAEDDSSHFGCIGSIWLHWLGGFFK